jgi:endonuclease/exonuclease/phosphatase family metal-dependent hydrolase
LRYLHAQDNRPWICAGDFNEVLRLEEQLGGNDRSAVRMERFRTCLDDCGLADLGFSGYEYTWNNRREGADNIQARLDRAVCNSDFLEIFPATSVEHIMTEESDHLALLIRVADSIQTQHPPPIAVSSMRRCGRDTRDILP